MNKQRSLKVRKLLIALCASVAFVPTIARAEAPTYEQMMREPNRFIHTSDCWRGRVFQIQEWPAKPGEYEAGAYLLVAPNPSAMEVVTVSLIGQMREPRILEGDTVDFCGVFTRLRTYKTAGNFEVTSPVIATYNYDIYRTNADLTNN
jgi:hypothetical protein